MKARLFLLLLLAISGRAGETEPKARPRLTPPAAGEEKREAAAMPGLESEPGFRSFASYLQAEARRPAGLDAVAVRQTAGSGATASRVVRPAAARNDPATATAAEVFVLPTVEVTAQKGPVAATQLADIESQLRSGEKASEETWLDSILNPASFPFLLGGETAKARAARARRRAEVLGWERVMLLSLEVEKSPAARARIEADIALLNTILRGWR
jgi:hypothetical protein